METSNLDENNDHAMMNSKLKSSNQGQDSSSGIDSYPPDWQDGGNEANAMERRQGDFTPNLDGTHMNSDMSKFGQGPPDQNMVNDNYGKMNETMPQQSMSNYNNAYGRHTYQTNPESTQHGGVPNSGNPDYSQQNNQYGPYSQQNMRPGFSQGPRGPHNMPVRPNMGMGGVGMMPPNYPSSQQRLLSGPSIQQQGGPTPTLNQLLQNANSNSRYQGGYSEYPGQQKGSGQDMSAPGYGGTQGWNGDQPPRQGMNPYQQSIPGNQPYRAQV